MYRHLSVEIVRIQPQLKTSNGLTSTSAVDLFRRVASELKFKVEGPGRIAAVDNGNAATVEPFQADSRKAFSGMCLVILRSRLCDAGKIQIGAASERLRSAETQIIVAH